MKHFSTKIQISLTDCSWFDLEEMDEAECKAEFRVKKKDLTALAKSLFILP